MGKILSFLAVALAGLGALFASRTAKAAPVGANIGPGVEGIGPVPLGSSPLGIGNNNPFNLEFRASVQWRGQLGTDGRFAVFDTALNGIRAGMINVHTKMTRDGANTVRKLITRLSPPFENPTEAFIQFVSTRIGVASEQPIEWRAKIIQLTKAIIQFENGQQPYSDELIQQALQETGKT